MSLRFNRAAITVVTSVALLTLVSGAAVIDWTRAEPNEEQSGGDTTVHETNRRAFSLPAANMSLDRRARFAVGHAFFNMPWVEAPSSTRARDGLGPHFIGRACTACHSSDGRAAPPEPGEQPMGLLFRLSVPGKGRYGAPKPEPTYGGQFTNQTIDGVKVEGQVAISSQQIEGQFADGESYALLKPSYRFVDLGYGLMRPDVQFSPRIAPQVIGMGLLEAIPARDILSRVDPADRDGDGISGRANWVWNAITRRKELGRFGWKANTPSVAHQTGGAANGDMGITSRHFPQEECMPAQGDCQQAPRGGKPEINDKNMASLVFYTHTLAVPARRAVDAPQVLRGKQVFHRSQCAACHVPTHVTGMASGFPELSKQTIRPYTDLLVHDMGEGLADHRPDFEADGREWRTPPLWGIGLFAAVNGHTSYLHDGRARNLSEAILWHGGEATRAQRAFVTLSKGDREALLAFLNSL